MTTATHNAAQQQPGDKITIDDDKKLFRIEFQWIQIGDCYKYSEKQTIRRTLLRVKPEASICKIHRHC